MIVIIAWDKATDTAVQPERLPNDGEWCRITDGNRVTKRHYKEPVVITPDPVANITDVVFSGSGYDETQEDGRVDLLSDTNITVAFNVDLPNGTKLTIPIRNRHTRTLKVIRAVVTNGSVSKSFKIIPSGFWFINSEEINNVGREGVDFHIDEIIILVQDA